MNDTGRVNRRTFIRNGSLFLLGSPLVEPGSLMAKEAESKPLLRLGLLTDLHHADKPPAGSRHYRDTLAKLEVAAEQFKKSRPEHVVELGDIIDAAPSVAVEKKYLKRINTAFTALPGRKHYVLGNHCVDTLTKEEFLEGVERPKSFYAFDAAGIHMIILDACFRGDGKPYERRNFQWTDANIPPEELDWLKADLKKAPRRTLVFVHQRLDVDTNHGIRNAAAVRTVLEQSGKVFAVFQGHNHINDHKIINGIHYVTLMAMIEGAGLENNGFALLDVLKHDALRLDGFVKQSDYSWT